MLLRFGVLWQVETGLAFNYKSIAEKQVSNNFYAAGSYATSLVAAHLPFNAIILSFYFTYVPGLWSGWGCFSGPFFSLG